MFSEKLFTLGIILLFLLGCSPENTQEEVLLKPTFPPYSDGVWYQPSQTDRWQWQLQHALNFEYPVEIYDIDLFDTEITTIETLHNSGIKVICYISAGTYEDWRSDINSFPPQSLGKHLSSREEERWLDIRDDAVFSIMKKRLHLAKEKGCDGVEPDNIDGYQNDTGFPLSAQDQLNYNAKLANSARALGLAIGLKNDPLQATALEPYFDFVLTEECNIYNECSYFDVFIDNNKAVWNAEYDAKYVNNTESAREKLCQDMQTKNFRTLVLSKILGDTFRHSCD